jgi:hypothetical protein
MTRSADPNAAVYGSRSDGGRPQASIPIPRTPIATKAVLRLRFFVMMSIK